MFTVRHSKRFGRLITVLANFFHIGSPATSSASAIMPNKASGATADMPTTLAGFGYTFDEAGKLRQVDAETGVTSDLPYQFVVRADDAAYNQRRYEALGDVITEHVYELLATEAGLQRIAIPLDATADVPATFVFANRADFSGSRKLLVLINGSGAVRAGQWARSLIINQSLSHGSQLPYIKRALQLDYDVLVLNTNDNRRDGRVIAQSSDPRAHAAYVWRHLVAASPAKVAIVAHSYGGVVTQQLAQEFPEQFAERVFAVGFTDSVHGGGGGGGRGAERLERVARNWVSSSQPLNEPVGGGGGKFGKVGGGVPMFSAGHEKHEWTSWACMDPLFDYLEEKYRELGVAGAVPVVECGAAADAAEAEECRAACKAAKAAGVVTKMEVVVGADDVPKKKSKTDL